MHSTRIGAGIGVAALLSLGASALSQTYYQASDGTIDFEKVPFADPTDPANWDSITPAVAITRANVEGIYNPIQESGFSFSGSPLGTLWYFGGTVQDVIDGALTLDDFNPWYLARPGLTPEIVGMDAVVYLEAEDAYFDLMFTDWGVGPSGGGAFAYTRAIVPAPATGAVIALIGIVGVRRRR